MEGESWGGRGLVLVKELNKELDGVCTPWKEACLPARWHALWGRHPQSTPPAAAKVHETQDRSLDLLLAKWSDERLHDHGRGPAGLPGGTLL